MNVRAVDHGVQVAKSLAIAVWAATMTTSGVATFILAGSEESEAA